MSQNNNSNNNGKAASAFPVRKMMVTAVMTAVSVVLMMPFLEFSIPIMPAFLKLDVSDLPALMTSFALGPLYGGLVCLLKNLIHLAMSSTLGVGELSNFLLGVFFVVPAGLIYKKLRTKKGAVLGAFAGDLVMALICWPVNFLLIYPLYEIVVGYNREAILGMYQAILPSVKSLGAAIAIFNIPFTFVKGLLSVVITLLIYKPLSPLLHGRR